MRQAALFLGTLLLTQPVTAETLTGKVWVVDGDTIKIRGQRIRLEGIDAPEDKQPCWHADGGAWACGQAASHHLRSLVRGRTATCRSAQHDRYGRWLAICWIGKTELNEEMVRSGLAVAYRRFSKRYVEVENEARGNGRGIWSGKFEQPEAWRHGTTGISLPIR